MGLEEGTNRRDYPYHLSTPKGAVGVVSTVSGTWFFFQVVVCWWGNK
jgi:hypothetical protein